MTEDQFGKILDRVPFLDGSGRRRFVAGGIILIGIAAPNWGQLQTALGGLGVADILGSPLIAAGAVLMVYAIGSLADMFGELFLVRAASGIFWAFRFPNRLVKFESKALSIMTRSFLFIFVAPFVAFIFVLYGFIGRTRYTIDIEKLLYPGAQDLYRDLPQKVTRGLSQPVGDDAEFAQKYIIDQLQSEADRKWARRIFARAKDVAATITALQIIFLYMLFAGPASLLGGEDIARRQEEMKLVQIDKKYRQAQSELEQVKLDRKLILKE